MIVDGKRIGIHVVSVMMGDLAQRENIPDSVVFSKLEKKSHNQKKHFK